MNAILTEEPLGLAGSNRSLPQLPEHILRHCLEKDPEERYQSARDLLFDLQMLAERSALTGSPGAGRLHRREWVAWTGRGLFILAVLLVILAYFWRAPNNLPVVRLLLPLPAQTTLEVGQFRVLPRTGSSLPLLPDLLPANRSSGCRTCIAWPGSRFAYATENGERSLDLWALPLSGDRQPIPLVQTPLDDGGGQFSPDGRWLAYFSNESGRWEVYVRTFPSPSGKSQVSTAGGVEPRWRGDGKELFYRALDGKLMAVAFKADSRFEVLATKPLFQMRLAIDRDSVRYAATADGQRFLVNTPAGDATNPFIAVVLNWAAELRR